MPHFGYELQSNTPCEHKSATRIGYTYLKAGRRKVHTPLAVVLGTADPDLLRPEDIVETVQRKLKEADTPTDEILAIALLKDCDKHPIKRLSRLGGIAISTPNHFSIPVMNTVPGEVDEWGIAQLRLRDPESTPEVPHVLKSGVTLRPAIVLPVFTSLHERHPVTDAIEVEHSIFVGLHGIAGAEGEPQFMETIIDRNMLG